MGPIWGRQDPGGPHVGPMKLAIYVCYHGRWYVLQTRTDTFVFNIGVEFRGRIHFLFNYFKFNVILTKFIVPNTPEDISNSVIYTQTVIILAFQTHKKSHITRLLS